MRSLVTGGAGFIGSHLVDALIARGGEVVALDNLKRGSWGNLAAHRDNPALLMLEGDIRSSDTLRDACRGVDVVYHLAAQSNVLGANQDLAYSVSTNVEGTANVLAAALEAGAARVVLASSREVYGDATSLPVKEDALLAPKNLYGASKVAGEAYAAAFATKGLEVNILRFANVYGPRDRDRVIPLWVDAAERGEELKIYGGKQLIDFVGVDTVVAALLQAGGRSLPAPVNVGSGKGTRLPQLAERILALSGSKSPVAYLPARGDEVLGFVADTTAMRTVLEIEPSADPLGRLGDLVGRHASLLVF